MFAAAFSFWNDRTRRGGKEKIEEVGQKIFELIVNTASANKSKSEINGYGDEEFNPWQVGVVM